MQGIRSSSTPVVTEIFDPNQSRARRHCYLKLGFNLKYLTIDQLLLSQGSQSGSFEYF